MQSLRPARLLLLILTLAAGALALDAAPAAAQVAAAVAPSDTVWEIRLADGSTVIGQVVAATAQRITIRTAAGLTAEVDRAAVQRMLPARGTVRDGRIWPEDPNRTRLFFGPTGRMLDAGDGYIGVFELFLPFVSWAVTDYFTIAGGTPILPDAIGRFWYFAPKVGGSIGERTHLSAGVFAFTNLDTGLDDDFETGGILYLAGTRGTEDVAASFGLGWGFAGDEMENRPVAMLGFEARTSPRLKLISENYLITYRDWEYPMGQPREVTRALAILSGGVRFIGERLSADAGVALAYAEDVIDSGLTCCVPLVNFVYNFGGRR